MKECLRVRHYASDEEVKTAVMKWLEECQQKFTKQGYMLSFGSGTLLLRETTTMFRSGDVIHVWVIIPVLKKAFLFDSYLYILYLAQTMNILTQVLVEKLIGWPRYCHGLWPNGFFNIGPPSLSTRFFHWYSSALISLVKKVIHSRYDFIIWNVQPMNIPFHPRVYFVKLNIWQ